jgi:hypothetical protein
MKCLKTHDQVSPPKEVVVFFETYNKLWSEGNFEYIASDIYDLPMTLYLQDTVRYLKSSDEVKIFSRIPLLIWKLIIMDFLKLINGKITEKMEIILLLK